MKNCVHFCVTLLSLNLLVNGEFELMRTDNTESVAIDLCNLQPEKGPCKQKLVRYYYSKLFNRCEQFKYGGCEGSPNNFYTRKDCLENCPGKFVYTRQFLHCFGKPEKGSCHENIPSFYYDSKTNKCKKFTYGGCDGNDNRFSSIKECINECRTYKLNLQMNFS